MAQDVTQAKAAAAGSGRMQVLLIEDDDGDALLVQELLLEAQAAVTLQRARSMAEARPLLPGATCVLLDLGLPDTRELQGVRWLQEHLPQVAVVVLDQQHLHPAWRGSGGRLGLRDILSHCPTLFMACVDNSAPRTTCAVE